MGATQGADADRKGTVDPRNDLTEGTRFVDPLAKGRSVFVYPDW